MNELAFFAPGGATIRLALSVLVQATLVVLIAAIVSRAALRRHAPARHTLWLGVLLWVLLSPAVGVLALHGPVIVEAALFRLPDGHEVAPRDRPAMPVLGDADRGPVGTLTSQTAPEPETTPISVVATPRALPAPARVPLSVRLAGGVPVVWAAGTLLALIRLAVGGRRLARLTRSSRPLDSDRARAVAEKARERLGMNTAHSVLTSDSVAGPIAVGLSRGRIVLPEGLAESLTDNALCDVLVHEGAHLLRRDPWIGLLQRVAVALHWPFPLIYYVCAQLSRAREEVCDNYVLRAGDPRAYAHTLLNLTERCHPLGVARAGLGLLEARWTLADRVAGLIDPRRVAMTRSNLRVKAGLALVVGLSGVFAVSIRLDAQTPPTPKVGSQSASGIVVDEQGRQVGGATVQSLIGGGEPVTAVSAADGTFKVTSPWLVTRGFLADVDGGKQFGLVSFDTPRPYTSLGVMRIVVKPSRSLTVRVRNAAGEPVAGAVVEARTWIPFSVEARTDADGNTTLRVPADAPVRWVLGHKSEVGFDYVISDRDRPGVERREFPSEVNLTLDGARTVRFKAVDSSGQPVPGVVFSPRRLPKGGKPLDSENPGQSKALSVTTDKNGLAVFDWLPKDSRIINPFEVQSEAFFCPEPPRVDELGTDPPGPVALTVRMVRKTALSGTVRLPDGRPAPGVRVMLNGEGAQGQRFASLTERTSDDGTYSVDVAPGLAYLVSVQDDSWAAPSQTGVIVREGQPRGGVNFALVKGTLLHGRVTEGAERKPLAGVSVRLVEEGGPLPKEVGGDVLLRDVLRNTRVAMTDAEGEYHFRLAPGHYLMQGTLGRATEPTTITVNGEPEIVHDIALKPARRTEMYRGIVIEKTPNGNRPVAQAPVLWVTIGQKGSGGRVHSDAEGRFRQVRPAGSENGFMVYVRVPDGTLAGFARVAANEEDVTVAVAPAATLSGRVVDSNGKPQAGRIVLIQLDSGPDFATAGHLVLGLRTDEQGRFRFSGAPVRSQGEISTGHFTDGRRAAGRTVVEFGVYDANPIEIPDVVVPPAETKGVGKGSTGKPNP